MPIIHWFRRDFRLHDNTALRHAAKDAPDGIVPVFIFDDAILRHPDTGAPIVAFMLDCLADLRDQLRRAGGDLLFLHGKPIEQLRRLAKLTGATAVYFNKDYAPSAVERDEEVERLLPLEGVAVKAFKDQVIFEEQEILAASSGEPYTVYSPYRKSWLEKLAEEFGPLGPEAAGTASMEFFGDGSGRMKKETLKTNNARSGNGIDRIELPTVRSLGYELAQKIEIPAGEAAARKRLAAFCDKHLRTYGATRNLPALWDGTSRLSPHLRHGTLSPRQCLREALLAKKEGGRTMAIGADTWIGELIWREFYQQILFNFPEVESQAFKAKYRARRWRESEKDWRAWCDGRTGFPIVDAGMRQLNATGWMHNRLRMIVAMFLTKDLLLDYRLGERYFMRLLIDGETAQNNGGWQWSASTGTDAQPWFRIFNPASQSEKCDPGGHLIRRWCPELSAVPDRFIHAPHRMSELQQHEAKCIIGRDYPAPIVDHVEARKAALDWFKGNNES